MLGQQVLAHLVHEMAVHVEDLAAAGALEVDVLVAVVGLVGVLVDGPLALAGDVLHHPVLAGQLVQIAVDGGGVGAFALGLQVGDDVGGADGVPPVGGQVVQDEIGRASCRERV